MLFQVPQLPQRAYTASYEDQLKEAGKKPEAKITSVDVAGRSVRYLQKDPQIVFSGSSNKFEWSYKTRGFLLEDIRRHCGCSQTRLTHALARLKGNRFNYKRRLKPTRNYIIKTLTYDGDLYLKSGRGWSNDAPIRAILKELYSRRPYLKAARSWYRDLTD